MFISFAAHYAIKGAAPNRDKTKPRQDHFGPDVQAMRIRPVIKRLSRRFRQTKGKERRWFAPLFGHVRNG
jgi:hypothetical protein